MAKHQASELFPVDPADAIRRWDANEIVWTVEMGGMGPGYEQCIQVLMMEIVRDHGSDLLPAVPAPELYARFGEEAVRRLNPKLGFSGAQVGVAKHLAYRLIRDGWQKSLDSVSSDRHIQVRKHFPEVA